MQGYLSKPGHLKDNSNIGNRKYKQTRVRHQMTSIAIAHSKGENVIATRSLLNDIPHIFSHRMSRSIAAVVSVSN